MCIYADISLYTPKLFPLAFPEVHLKYMMPYSYVGKDGTIFLVLVDATTLLFLMLWDDGSRVVGKTT